MLADCLTIRADASVRIGTGHVMRCLALAQAWQDAGGRVTFAMRESTPALDARLRAEQCEVVALQGAVGTSEDAENTAAIAHECGAQWLVVDGYGFGADYQRALKQNGCRVLWMDDNGHASPYCADLVLNQNVYANEMLYSDRSDSVRLLLGPRYCLLRREFLKWRSWTRKSTADGARVLITMGGSDPDNRTQSILAALQKFPWPNLTLTVAVGGSNPYHQELQEAARLSDPPAVIVSNSLDMPTTLASADVAIASAGTTCWELCFLGLPALLVVLAENQEGFADELSRRGIARNLGRADCVTPAVIRNALRTLLQSERDRQRMSELGRRLVDGLGSARLVSLMQSEIELRRTTQNDYHFLWQLANDVQTRQASFDNASIPLDAHIEWFASKMADPNAILYTATDAVGTPLGYTRFQRDRDAATISLSLTKEHRGRGLGRTLLLLSCERLFAETDVLKIDAYVKPDNEASLNLFSSAGFTQHGRDSVCGQTAEHFVHTRLVS